MKLRPFLPAASIVLAGIAAVVIWNYSANLQHGTDEGFTISGRVNAAEPSALENAQVRIRWLEDGVVRSVSVPVRKDGTFSADRLLPGTYTLAAVSAAEGKASSQPSSPASVTVSAADVTGIVLKLAGSKE